ncbi:hypothetical protein [Mobiluncus mulieris]|uniref:Uncharacterized protein n=1 Tax=Mobiluncus mulieris TaxID=2052 RepID=A0ABD4TVY9_9ACTO|nr:hypothetical protein [Mobiluncus mulieris]MCU9968599.1 hypothetical protein [Mobiluncus mulieris]MCU9972834.1 hypothetical protein [Mobiluncus mulieris]MCV0009055.1 hypothetical protein [Mobiluncus mulieris]NMW74934.1 hypothetical protein [Mobiluncus mulieris]NMX01118.1 hypothetical protein [Mobiluncus mulieris]
MAKKSILLILVTVGAVFLAVPGFTATPPHKTATATPPNAHSFTARAVASPVEQSFPPDTPPPTPSPSPGAIEAKQPANPSEQDSLPVREQTKPSANKDAQRVYREAKMRYYGWHTLSEAVSINQFESSPAAWGHPNPEVLALTFPRVLDEETEVSDDTTALFVSDWRKEPVVRAGLRFCFTPTCHGKTAASFVGTYWLARNARSSAENVANHPAFDAAIDEVVTPGATATTPLGYDLRFALENGIGTLLANPVTGQNLYADSSLAELANRLEIQVNFPIPADVQQLKAERDKFKAAYAVFALTQDVKRAALLQASEKDRVALEAAASVLKKTDPNFATLKTRSRLS